MLHQVHPYLMWGILSFDAICLVLILWAVVSKDCNQ